MRTKDIVKGVVYDRGTQTLNGVTKHLTLVAMVIASDRSLVTDEHSEYIVMGSCDVSNEIRELVKYKCPYKFGDIGSEIVDVSSMDPDYLEEIN